MRRLGRWVLVLLFLLPTFALAGVSSEVKAAKGYLEEVKKHLLHSYVFAEKLSDAQLVKACRDGFVKVLSDESFAKVDSEVRSGLAEALGGDHDGIGDLLDTVKSYLKEHEVTSFPVIPLADAGARAMVAQTGDPFSRIFDAEEIQKLQRVLSGEERDDSLGIAVEQKGGRVSISYVMFDTTAYEAGLEIGDEITTVNGKPAKDLGEKQVATIGKVQPGTSITLGIRRQGWSRPIDFKMTQHSIPHDEVLYEMLPGGIGYMRITMFPMPANLFGGANAFPQVDKALKALKKEGMKGLVLDLRFNPGGALQTVIPVADKFIGGGQLITKTETHLKLELPFKLPFNLPGMGAGNQEYTSNSRSEFQRMPMVVLTNGATASASELLTGALQDLHRATVIGETTYGKGIGQSAVPLFSTSSFMGGGAGVNWGKGASPFLPNRFLYLTVMKYYLPSGRSIHHKGVVPDLVVHNAEPEEKTFRALRELEASGAIAKYLDGQWDDHADDFEALAAYDDYSSEKYPGFTKFYRSLSTSLSEDQVRGAVREEARKRIASATKKAFLTDLENDTQLQTGVLQLAGELDGK